jgi:hypothetical protein
LPRRGQLTAFIRHALKTNNVLNGPEAKQQSKSRLRYDPG